MNAEKLKSLFRQMSFAMPRCDLSLETADCGQWLFHAIFLCTLLAHMTCLAAFSLEAYSHRWKSGVGNQMTILIAPLSDSVAAGKVSSLDERAGKTIEILRSIPEIGGIRLLEAAQTADIIAPWLGDGFDAASRLPLPAVIDLKAGGALVANPSPLRERLKNIAGLSIDSHASWIAKAHAIFSGLRWSVVACLSLLALAISCLMIVVARAAIAISSRDIAILLTCGATDWYIMRQFLVQAGIIAARAGIVASAFFLPAGIAISLLLAPAIAPAGSGWNLALFLGAQTFLLPAAIAALCAATAAGTAFAFLRRQGA